MNVVSLPLDSLVPTPGNRAPAQVAELAASIQKVGYLLQPVVVRAIEGGGWQLLAGHRRVAACRLLGWREVPCVVLDAVAHPELLTLAENVARRELVPSELCEAVYQLRQQGMTEPDIAAAVGFSRMYVRNLARVRENLVPEVWAVFVRHGRAARIREFIRLAGRPARVQRAEVLGGATVRETTKSERPTRAAIRAQLDRCEGTIRGEVLRWVLGEGAWPELSSA